MRVYFFAIVSLFVLGVIGFYQPAVAGIPIEITSDMAIASDIYFMTGLTVTNSALVTIESGSILYVYPDLSLISGSGIWIKSGGELRVLTQPAQTADVVVLLLGGAYYPYTQFFITEQDPGCNPQHVQGIFDPVYSTALVTWNDPNPLGCNFGLVSEVPMLTIQMTQEQIDAWELTTGIPIILP